MHRPLGSVRRALDVLAGESAGRGQQDPGSDARGHLQLVLRERNRIVGVGVLLQRAGADVRPDELVMRPARCPGREEGVRADLSALPMDLPRGVLGTDVRTAERPAAAEREGEAEPQLPGPLGGVREVGQELRGAESARPLGQRVLERDLGPTDAGGGHRGQVAVDVGAGGIGPEPPPAHHRPRFGGRVDERTSEVGQADRRRSHDPREARRWAG